MIVVEAGTKVWPVREQNGRIWPNSPVTLNRQVSVPTALGIISADLKSFSKFPGDKYYIVKFGYSIETTIGFVARRRDIHVNPK